MSLDKYEIKPYIFASNLWAVYHNNVAIYCNIYKSACKHKLKEIISRCSVCGKIHVDKVRIIKNY